MKKMIFLFLVQKALIYYTFIKSHLNSFNLLVIPHVANFRYVANFRFLTLALYLIVDIIMPMKTRPKYVSIYMCELQAISTAEFMKVW